MGLQNVADKLRSRLVEGQDPSLFIGTGHPDQGKTHSRIKLRVAVASSARDGEFSDTIDKSIIVAIFSEWEGLYRRKIAKEVGVEAKRVTSDLMGDLRIVRNWIVHSKSVVGKNCTRIKVLSWQLHQDQELKVTGQMFSSLIDEINAMSVEVRAV